MTWQINYDTFNSSGFGLFVKITYVNSNYLAYLDSILRLNNNGF